eukprot:NODE_2533_length_549_cov_180.530806_g2483_i0.p1 GENE.NODE_2533_length_549_cov_180.530806_g2483_i0~~NODE_2533_length_549_cov_180.530806_g2483_i0.p1  ORF type:complete len:120 (+),score=33.46 NODE_2533_length_549_cov_180.530806_g2483_i0:101-460(+)
MASIPANLIVNMTFNPPQIKIVGPIKEATLGKLSSILPQVQTSSPGAKSVGNFEKVTEPPHWSFACDHGYAEEGIGQSQMMLTILDCLEEEGGWSLKGSNALNHDEDKETYKFFFVRKQ